MEQKLEEVIGAVKRIAQYVAMAEAHEQAEDNKRAGLPFDFMKHREMAYKDMLGSLGIE